MMLPQLYIGDRQVFLGRLPSLLEGYTTLSITEIAADPAITLLGLDTPPGVVELRAAINRFAWRPFATRREFLIVLQLDVVSVPGANCLLKFLEEPSQSTTILLQSTTAELLPTIRSRVSVQYLSQAHQPYTLGQTLTGSVAERLKYAEQLAVDPAYSSVLFSWIEEARQGFPEASSVEAARQIYGALLLAQTGASKRLIFERLLLSLPAYSTRQSNRLLTNRADRVTL